MGHPLSPGTTFFTDIPPRLDRLPWSRWHWRVVVALGIIWTLDGLEITLLGAVGSQLREKAALGLTESQIGASASAYLAGAVGGALFFGRLTDMMGRRRLFLATLGLYLGATFASALAWDFRSFAALRLLTGAGIGGEYAAVNSAIDELLPARVRGRADLAINATYWLGAALGAVVSIALLNPRVLPPTLGWRACFGVGALIGLSILGLRNQLPESPRWLLLHGRLDEARSVVDAIEREVAAQHLHATAAQLPPPGPSVRVVAMGRVTFSWIARVLARRHPRRTVLGLLLVVAQAFAYNGVFFTYSLVLARYYGVPSNHVGYYLLPFAAGNLLGPIALGPLFDSWGRRTMIALTYGASGALLALTGYAIARSWLDAATQTASWCAVFFIASAAASSAYLTVSELFPVELRGMAIAFFYAVGTAVGGLGAPALFGGLIEAGTRHDIFLAYVVGASLMMLAALGAVWLGVPAERKSLEQIAMITDR